jgi:hypothetical protein
LIPLQEQKAFIISDLILKGTMPKGLFSERGDVKITINDITSEEKGQSADSQKGGEAPPGPSSQRPFVIWDNA